MLSAFYIQICAITHCYGLVYTAVRGKDVGGKKMSLSCLCLHLNFWCFGNKYPSLILCSICLSLLLCLPAPLESCISESQCTLNSYVLVSYGYNLRWRARVPFPFSALRAQYQRSRNVQCGHETYTQGRADIVQAPALTHALHSVLCIIIVI